MHCVLPLTDLAAAHVRLRVARRNWWTTLARRHQQDLDGSRALLSRRWVERVADGRFVGHDAGAHAAYDWASAWLVQLDCGVRSRSSLRGRERLLTYRSLQRTPDLRCHHLQDHSHAQVRREVQVVSRACWFQVAKLLLTCALIAGSFLPSRRWPRRTCIKPTLARTAYRSDSVTLRSTTRSSRLCSTRACSTSFLRCALSRFSAAEARD